MKAVWQGGLVQATSKYGEHALRLAAVAGIGALIARTDPRARS